MPLDETRCRPRRDTTANSATAVGDPAKPGERREVERLRELAAWYREFMERAGNPTIWQSRLRMAEELAREADRLERQFLDRAPAPSVEPAGTRPVDRRTRILLEAPILPTLLRLAWPNIVVMLVMASTGLIETWWVSRLGTDALAGIALVFPLYMMMQMLSAGAMGGGISSAIARALGGGRREDADALVLHAIVINLALGIACSGLVLAAGPALYRALGGEGASLEAALGYSDVVFAGVAVVWLMNALASVIRGGGNMWVPSVWICVGVVLLVPLSPCLIFGFGPVPALGMAGAGAAVVITTALTTLALGWYIAAGRSVARFRWAQLRWKLFADILRVGAVASISTLQTSLTVLLTTALVGIAAGPEAIAGYGTGNRLEFLLVPLVFGLGAPLVALVGTNIGAGQKQRALRIALIGGAIAFGLCEAIGLAAAIWPTAWLGLFDNHPRMLAAGGAYLRHVGPAYGFFGLGLALYFASQGAGRLLWPLSAGLVRLVIAVGGGWVAFSLTGAIDSIFTALSAALVTYGVMLSAAVASGVWFRHPLGVFSPMGYSHPAGLRDTGAPVSERRAGC
jgi:putative MATE family efflux protein